MHDKTEDNFQNAQDGVITSDKQPHQEEHTMVDFNPANIDDLNPANIEARQTKLIPKTV